YNKLVTNDTCGSFSNTVIVTARSTCGTPVQAQANAVCTVTGNPCLSIGATCSTTTNGQTVLLISVTNCGNVTITGIDVVNDPDDDDDLLGTIPSLAPGQTATITNSSIFPPCFVVSGEVGAFGTSPCGPAASDLAEYSCGVAAITCIGVT